LDAFGIGFSREAKLNRANTPAQLCSSGGDSFANDACHSEQAKIVRFCLVDEDDRRAISPPLDDNVGMKS
jgi:hypothetical protein